MGSKINWNELEKSTVLEGLVTQVANSRPFTTAKGPLVDFTLKAQEALPKERRKSRSSLYGWIDYNKDLIDSMISAKVKNLSPIGEAVARSPAVILQEMLESQLRPKDIEELTKMERVFQAAATHKLEMISEEILAKFDALLVVKMKALYERAVTDILSNIEQAKKLAEEATSGRTRLSTRPREKTTPKVMIVGCDKAQARILEKDYGGKMEFTFVYRENNPPRNLRAAARSVDRVFFLSSSAGAKFRQALNGDTEVTSVPGGVSTLKPLLNNVLTSVH